MIKIKEMTDKELVKYVKENVYAMNSAEWDNIIDSLRGYEEHNNRLLSPKAKKEIENIIREYRPLKMIVSSILVISNSTGKIVYVANLFGLDVIIKGAMNGDMFMKYLFIAISEEREVPQIKEINDIENILHDLPKIITIIEVDREWTYTLPNGDTLHYIVGTTRQFTKRFLLLDPPYEKARDPIYIYTEFVEMGQTKKGTIKILPVGTWLKRYGGRLLNKLKRK